MAVSVAYLVLLSAAKLVLQDCPWYRKHTCTLYIQLLGDFEIDWLWESVSSLVYMYLVYKMYEAAHFSLDECLLWVCCVALPCCSFDLVCFSFLPSHLYMYMYSVLFSEGLEGTFCAPIF